MLRREHVNGFALGQRRAYAVRAGYRLEPTGALYDARTRGGQIADARVAGNVQNHAFGVRKQYDAWNSAELLRHLVDGWACRVQQLPVVAQMLLKCLIRTLDTEAARRIHAELRASCPLVDH